jgi:hypothetical protein
VQTLQPQGVPGKASLALQLFSQKEVEKKTIVVQNQKSEIHAH